MPGSPFNLNERLVAAAIIRQVLLMRFSLYVRNMMTLALNTTERPIAAMVRETLHAEEAGLRDPAQMQRLDRLIDQMNAIRRPIWDQVTTVAESQMFDLAEAEPESERSVFGLWLPSLTLTVPLVGLVGAQALGTPFQGRTLRQWLADAADDEAKRFRQAVYAGLGAGEDSATIARRVFGTASLNGTDGATQTSRNHIDAVMRSATTHFSSYARDQFRRANDAAIALNDAGQPVVVMAQEQFVAVLDSRTTQLCRGLDGKLFPVGEGPIPPLHINCRSGRVLVLPESLGGPFYDPGTFNAWVRLQPNAVQDLILGPTKAAKIRRSNVDLGAFRDYGAKPMNLDQTREEFERVLETY